jgi:hypothetical protein
MNMNLAKLRLLPFALLFAAECARGDSPSWQSDPQHPLLQYRFECRNGAETVLWRSGYPGAVTLKARMKSSSYDGMEDVKIEPQSEARSPLETMYCGTFQVTVARFSMAPPPVPDPVVPSPVVPDPSAAAAEAAAPPVVPGLLRFEPPKDPLPQITPQALESVKVGMKEAEVLQKLGEPLSKILIPEEGKLMGTYRYSVAGGHTSAVRLENGIVSGIMSR